MSLLGIVAALALLIWLAYRGWSVLLLAPLAALVAAAAAREPLLAHWTQTFMGGAAGFLAQFFPLFLLGALLGKLMDDSGSVQAIARFMTERLGSHRAMLAVVVAGAIVTYGGVSLFVAFFVLAPMAQSLFRGRQHPAPADAGGDRSGNVDLHDVGAAGDAGHSERDPDAFLRNDALRRTRPRDHRLGHHAGFRHVVAAARRGRGTRAGEGYGAASGAPARQVADDEFVRERAITAREFDPGRNPSRPSQPTTTPPIVLGDAAARRRRRRELAHVAGGPAAARPVVPGGGRGGAPTSLSAVGGVWSVVVALAAAVATVVIANRSRLPALRESMDAGANASVLPAFGVASLVGFGAVVAALPGFALVRDWVLGIGGGPLVSLAVATNMLAALTGSASGGMTIALDALGETYMQLAAEAHIDPALLHRVATISAGTLDSLPHNGAVVSLLAVCGLTHRESYLDMVIVGIVGALLALVAVIVLGSAFGSF